MPFFSSRVYADAAAATPLSREARREFIRLSRVFGNPGGIHKEAVHAQRELQIARERTAESLGAHPDEIIFTSGGTEANMLAIKGFLSTQGGLPSVVTSAIEHPSVLFPLRALFRDKKILLRELPVDEHGLVSKEALTESITDSTVLVSLQLVNSEIGTVQHVRDLMKLVRRLRKERHEKKNTTLLLVHTDASQAPLWLPLQTEKLGVDFMTLDGQKIMGPKGVGALYVRRGSPIRAVTEGGGQERGLRSGTENVAAIGAFSVALFHAQAGAEIHSQKIAAVRDALVREIKARIPQARINGAEGESRVANNCSVTIPGLLGDMGTVALDAEGIAVSTRSACSSDDEEPSHVLLAIGLSQESAKETLRITFLPSARERDAHRIAAALERVVKRYARGIIA